MAAIILHAFSLYIEYYVAYLGEYKHMLYTKQIVHIDVVRQPVYYINYELLNQYMEDAIQFLKEAPGGRIISDNPERFFRKGTLVEWNHGLVTVNNFSEKISEKDVVFILQTTADIHKLMLQIVSAALKARLYRGRIDPLFLLYISQKIGICMRRYSA